jgi:exopolyphosphatase/guanosine-5'-triphosphate,3'-diphosphate pyrophosphatase
MPRTPLSRHPCDSIRAVRVGVVDIGTNSTRLLVAEVRDREVEELDRRSIVTRLGQGVDATGRLADEAVGRVRAALAEYRRSLDEHGVERTIGVLTSAVRDAANGSDFVAGVREEFGLDARTIPGEEEARLTFLGATSSRGEDESLVVVDIGGGSTELVIGRGREVSFSVSTQVGVVRHTERHLADDPPTRPQLEALADDARRTFEADMPAELRGVPARAVAVAGTATSLGAIDLGLDPYDPAAVEGHELSLARCGELLEGLAAMRNAARREVVGLHPDRAPTIVAGVVILREALLLFGLDRVTVSEHDVLYGAALELAGIR